MTWYTASIVLTIKVKEGTQEYFPVFENFILLEAHSHDDAAKYAEKIGKEHEGEKVSLNDSEAEYIYLGTRKIRSVYNPTPLHIDDDRPTHETELTHSYYEVESIEKALLLADGMVVDIRYVDDNLSKEDTNS